VAMDLNGRPAHPTPSIDDATAREEDMHDLRPSLESAAYAPSTAALTWRDSPRRSTPHRV
jgi:hypothetical protein